MSCARCGWPTEESTILSTHPTSQGWVRYRRCACGMVAIELVTLAHTHDAAPMQRIDVREQMSTA